MFSSEAELPLSLRESGVTFWHYSGHPALRRSCGAVPENGQKARHRTRCFAARRARQTPCASRHRERRRIHESGHPWHASREVKASIVGWAERSEARQATVSPALGLAAQPTLLRQDAAQMGAPCGAARARREKPEGWRAGGAPVRCQHTDVLSANRRSALAQSEGRMPGDRATGGGFLDSGHPALRGSAASSAVRAAPAAQWLLSLGHSRESDPLGRRPSGSFAVENTKQINIKMDSRWRGNDEQEKRKTRPGVSATNRRRRAPSHRRCPSIT